MFKSKLNSRMCTAEEQKSTPKQSLLRLGGALLVGVLFLLFMLAIMPAQAIAGLAETDQETAAIPRLVSSDDFSLANASAPAAIPRLQGTPALTVNIVSSPWATLDNNVIVDGPRVFVVEAVITNTGTATATDLLVTLDYNEVGEWVLLEGEDENRALNSLGPGEAYHAYWFASYASSYSAGHIYTVTAQADGVAPVSTSENFYENPNGNTVETRSSQTTGNSYQIAAEANIKVGVAFSVTIGFDLGQGAETSILSPVGNLDFDPGAYRLLATKVTYFDNNDPPNTVLSVNDRLYNPNLPGNVATAEVVYTFIALTPSNTSLCPYSVVDFGQTVKYDKAYCIADRTIPITGTLAVSVTKVASSDIIQQGQRITYTINYTNTGDLPMEAIWFWDEVMTNVASIIPGTISPPSDGDETTDSRVAWDIGLIPRFGSPGYTGTLTFAVLVDGNGQDVPDSTALVNNAFMGVNQGSLPARAALTRTATTIVQAPTISVSKTDGTATAEPDDPLVYTLRITNSGSIPASGVVISDILPAQVNFTGPANPPNTSQVGQTLVWNNLGPIAANGGTVVIEVPVTVAPQAPEGTLLLNTAQVKYENDVAHIFATKTATDQTTVQAPVLTITKSDFPDPVLTGKEIDYTLHYTNSGSGQATNLLITDVVPLSTTYLSCGGGDSCSFDSGTGVVSWNISNLLSSNSGSVTFTVQVTDTLQTGDVIHNDDYGISADQLAFVSGPAVTTLVNREAAIIDGYAFNDANGNGVRDGGEVGIFGVAITLTQATAPFTTTDANGYYRFRVEEEIPITISASLPAGFFRTTPGEIVYLHTTLGVTKTLNFGYASTSSDFGVIFGTVFEDKNHNGVQDGPDEGIPGVTITSGQAVTPTVTTNEFGQYSLRYDSGGPVTITETNPSGYVSTTPDEVSATATIGSNGTSPVDFGDFQGIKIAGQVFDDANASGSLDGGEGGVAGASVKAGSTNFITTGSGVYTFYLKSTTTVTITETDPAGYLSTDAVAGPGLSKVDANTLVIDSPTSGTTYSGDFGDVLASAVITISGQVWEDNGAGGGGLANGQLDGSEPGLANAVVSLSSGLNTTTGPDGLFSLLGPANQVITVTETNPTGYASTNAIAGNDAAKFDNDTIVVAALSAGSTSADNLFGDVALSDVALISGTVFDDRNENGLYEPATDAPLAGVTVTLEVQDDGIFTVSTDAAGNYQFPVAPGANVRITSAGPGGNFYPTTPETIFESPTTAGEVLADRNFGYSDDTDVAVIMGVVFDDQNSDGNQGFGEPGLAGATITLDGGQSKTTDATGIFVYSVSTAGTYALDETDPPGYRSTTPNNVNVPVTALGQSYLVEFGDTNNNSIGNVFGTVFDDLNGNGQQDANETGLPGVVITVTAGANTIPLTTNAYGQFNYSSNTGGIHTISEQNPPGYRSTTPDQINVNIVLGQSKEVNFGDTQATSFSTIMGAVFNDSDGNGLQGPSELGIANAEIALSGGQNTTTNANGSYTFAVNNTGFVEVTETDLPGYHSTTPNQVTVQVTALGQIYVVNFGDSDNSALSSFFGTVFDDQNASGSRDLTEPALNNVTVTMNGTNVVSTNVWGQYTFLIEDPGTYTVVETDLAGYASTNAIPGSAAVTKVDNNTLQVVVNSLGTDFGNNQFADALNTTLAISKQSEDLNGEPLLEGDRIRYTIQVTNTGSYTAFNVTVTDDLSEYVTCRSVSGDNAPACADPLIWVIPALAPNNTVATLFVEVTIDGGSAGQSIANTASVTATNVADPPVDPPAVCPDGSPANPDGSCDSTPLPAAVLELSKASEDLNGPPLFEGDTVRYTIQVSNTGSDVALDVTVTDDLPDGVTFVEASADQGTVSGTDPVVWVIDTLPSNTAATLTIDVTLNEGTAGQSITNTASVTGTNVFNPPPEPPAVCPDGSPATPDGSCTTTPIEVGGDLSNSSKSVSPVEADLAVGDPVSYTITLSNTDSLWASPVIVTDTLPVTVTLKSVEVCQLPPPPEEYVVYLPLIMRSDSERSGQVHVNSALPREASSTAKSGIVRSNHYIQYSLDLDEANNRFVWTGALGPDAEVILCVGGEVAQAPWDSTNTAQISWSDQTISTSATGFSQIGFKIYLPAIMKNN